MTLTERLRSYHTLVEAMADAPVERRFLTCWDPGREPAEETLTFGEFTTLAARHAAWDRAHGVEAGDTVVLVLPHSVALMAAFAGALLAGALPSILAYPTFKVDPEKYRDGLGGVSAHLQARLVLLDAAFPPDLAACVEGVLAARLPSLDGLPGPLAPAQWASPDPDAIAFIQHSSGTTGLQKGVALSHRAVLRQLAGLADVLALEPRDRVASWLPLYHDMGLIATFLLPLAAHVAVITEPASDWVLWPGSFLRLVTEHRCTLAWQPNFGFQFLARRVDEEDRTACDLSSLRALVSCSEPVRAESMDEFRRVYAPQGLAPTALQASYAMAENVFAVSHGAPVAVTVDGDTLVRDGRAVAVPGDHPRARRLLSSGRCLPGHRVRVVDADGLERGEGGVGEILVTSDCLFRGYYRRPDLTARALHDDWYRTGDLGFVREGELYVLGRGDDVIVVGGKNLYPEDLEALAADHPDVHDGRVVAFGLFNADLGTEDVIIVAEMNSEECLPRTRAIEADIRQRVLGDVGVAPRLVSLVPPRFIVKSTAGKPARAATRDKLLHLRPELASRPT